MNRVQRIQLQQSENRQRIATLIDTPAEQRAETWSADLDSLKNELTTLETELQAALLVEPEAAETPTADSPESREIDELRESVEFGDYVQAALMNRGATGAALELNQALEIPEDHFPLEMLAADLETRDNGGGDLETRAAVNGDASRNQASWIDRLFADTAARRLGIRMPSVRPGISAYPVIGSNAAPVQRGRTEAATAATITATVTEIKPSRNAVHAVYSVEDNARLPGLADAIRRDLRAAMVEKIDRTVFVGDDGANEATADITGLQTAGISEKTLTQANKVKADKVLEAFVDFVDGIYAANLSDLNIVATVGSNKLWLGTVHNSAVSNETVARFLRENGLSWTTRGEIETATAADDFGAFVGLQRGIANAGVAPVWNSGTLIRDPYSGAKTGEVQLTLNYLWGLAFPRPANFKRLKYVA